METATVDTLEGVLKRFQGLVNGNERARALMKGWEPDIVLQTLDGASTFSLAIRRASVQEVAAGPSAAGHQISIRAEKGMLESIFSGDVNPSTAYIDGELEVYGNDMDRLKLDALTLVIWGA